MWYNQKVDSQTEEVCQNNLLNYDRKWQRIYVLFTMVNTNHSPQNCKHLNYNPSVLA